VTPAGERDIWALPPGGDPLLLVSSDADERAPMISPDGRHLAYVSSEGGRDEVYVRPWPEGTTRYKISSNGGREPQWRRDGRELFYRDGDRMYAVSIDVGGDTFRAGRPELLFEQPFAQEQFGNPNYDVSHDGERFLMIASPAGDSTREIPVIVNWFEQLERLGPDPGARWIGWEESAVGRGGVRRRELELIRQGLRARVLGCEQEPLSDALGPRSVGDHRESAWQRNLQRVPIDDRGCPASPAGSGSPRLRKVVTVFIFGSLWTIAAGYQSRRSFWPRLDSPAHARSRICLERRMILPMIVRPSLPLWIWSRPMTHEAVVPGESFSLP
jgi:hypothetical protein